jgi:hypothetical protein
MSDHGFRHNEELTLVTLVVSMLINYNSFAVSVICFPLVYLGTYFPLVSVRVGTYTNPTTNKLLTEAEQI